MKILIGTNIYGNNIRQDIARESWIHLQQQYPDLIELVALQFPFENEGKISRFGIPALFDLYINSRFYLDDSEKDIPSIKDILDILYKKAQEDKTITHIAYVNSDCILTKNFIDYMQQNDVPAFAASRLDIEPVDSFNEIKQKGINVIRSEPAGFDFFCYKKEWWNKYAHLHPEMLIGQPLFDVLYAGLIMLYGGKLLNDPQKPIICHIFHDNVSHKDSVEKRYNENKIKNSPFNQLVVNLMFFHLQHNLCKRRPWGKFTVVPEGEKEFTENFFEAMRLDTEKQIRYIE